MKKMLGFGALMVGLLLLAPEAAHGQKKDKKSGNVVPATADDYKNLARTTQVVGAIVSADAKTLTFRIDMSHLQPNVRPGRLRPGYPAAKVVHEYKEYEIDVSDKVVVKKMYVNADYDDKGNFKVDETASKELRSKGYILSKIEDIKSGNIAKIIMTPPKKEDQVEGVGNVAKPLAKTIYLEKEGTPFEPAKTPERKKKT